MGGSGSNVSAHTFAEFQPYCQKVNLGHNVDSITINGKKCVAGSVVYGFCRNSYSASFVDEIDDIHRINRENMSLFLRFNSFKGNMGGSPSDDEALVAFVDSTAGGAPVQPNVGTGVVTKQRKILTHPEPLALTRITDVGIEVTDLKTFKRYFIMEEQIELNIYWTELPYLNLVSSDDDF